MERGINRGSVDVVISRNVEEVSRVHSDEHEDDRNHPGWVDYSAGEFEIALFHFILEITSQHSYEIRSCSGVSGNVDVPEVFVRYRVF